MIPRSISPGDYSAVACVKRVAAEIGANRDRIAVADGVPRVLRRAYWRYRLDAEFLGDRDEVPGCAIPAPLLRHGPRIRRNALGFDAQNAVIPDRLRGPGSDRSVTVAELPAAHLDAGRAVNVGRIYVLELRRLPGGNRDREQIRDAIPPAPTDAVADLLASVREVLSPVDLPHVVPQDDPSGRVVLPNDLPVDLGIDQLKFGHRGHERRRFSDDRGPGPTCRRMGVRRCAIRKRQRRQPRNCEDGDERTGDIKPLRKLWHRA